MSKDKIGYMLETIKEFAPIAIVATFFIVGACCFYYSLTTGIPLPWE